jgi:hypothetical protein
MVPASAAGARRQPPGECRQKRTNGRDTERSQCRRPVLDVHDVKQQAGHARVAQPTLHTAAAADARSRQIQSFGFFGSGLGHLYPLACRRRALALPPVSPVVSTLFRAGSLRGSRATPRLGAYAAAAPIDRTTGRRSARRWMSVSNAWLPRFPTQHNREASKIQLVWSISRAQCDAACEKIRAAPQDSISAVASRRRFRSSAARAPTFYCYF